MNAETIARNIETVKKQLRDNARFEAVELCVVTKTQPVEAVNAVYDAGIHRIGENRVQEILQKLPTLNPRLLVDLIGQLQTNKVKYIVDCVSRVQSLDRMSLAQALDTRCKQAGRVMPCLVQVNIAREVQKSGLDEDKLIDFLRQASKLTGIRIEGLMAIMPLTADPREIRPYFKQMRVWFDRLREEAIEGIGMDVLSMGMSGDYVMAVQEGSTLVRVGSAIFGARS